MQTLRAGGGGVQMPTEAAKPPPKPSHAPFDQTAAPDHLTVQKWCRYYFTEKISHTQMEGLSSFLKDMRERSKDLFGY